MAPIALVFGISLLPAPDSLSHHVSYYFVTLSGVIRGLIVEPIPGTAIRRVAKTPRKPGERITTARRDALVLGCYQRVGKLTAVAIPDAQDEALRDLSRAREDAVRARLKTGHRLKALLLRHGCRCTGKSSWTAAHER